MGTRVTRRRFPRAVDSDCQLVLEDARSIREGLLRMARLAQDAVESPDARIEDEDLTGRALDRSALEGDVWAGLRREPYPLETSLPGVFAAGDVRSGSIKRVSSAVGEGSMAVRLVHLHLANVSGDARGRGKSSPFNRAK